jgi:hypothetical protein
MFDSQIVSDAEERYYLEEKVRGANRSAIATILYSGNRDGWLA